jgi:hypothetical protein
MEEIMQFFVYDPNFNPSDMTTPPSPELYEEMQKFVAETIRAKVLVTTGALENKSTRLVMKNGEFSVNESPTIELKELMAGWAVLKVDSLEEAIEWSKRFRRLIGDGVSEIVRIYGAE